MNAQLGTFLKQVDPWASTPACIAGAAIGLLRSRDASAIPLIIRPGGLGDLVCAHLALELLGVPIDQVEWLIEQRSQAWARHAGLRHACFDRRDFARALPAPRLRVINTEQRFGLSQAVGLLARARGGKLHCFSTNRAADATPCQTEYDPLDTHEVLAFARLFADAFALPQPAALGKMQRREPSKAHLLVGIAGRQEPTRMLSLDLWEELVADFSEGRGFQMIAAPVDAEFAQELAARFPGRAALHQGGFSSVCERIASSERFLTIDGGLVHVASYYGVPTTAVFTSGRHLKWAPLAEGSAMIKRTDLPCQPCTLFGQTPECPNRLVCHQLNLKENLITL